jgi:hypothetical protein
LFSGGMGLGFVGNIESNGQQVGMIAKTSDDLRRVAGGCDDRIAGGQGFFGDESAETTGSASDEPSTHDVSPLGVSPGVGLVRENYRRAPDEIIGYIGNKLLSIIQQ